MSDITTETSQAALWKGQPVEIVNIAKDVYNVPYVLLRFVLSNNQGAWVASPKSMDKDYCSAGLVARELLKASRRRQPARRTVAP
jgi:hypothetical protein